MAQRIVFEIVAEESGLAVSLNLLKSRLKELLKELKGLDEGSEAFKELKQKAIDTQADIINLTREQKKLNAELKQTDQVAPKGSLQALRIEYGKLSAELAKLSAAERSSDFGKNIIQNAARTKKEIDAIEQSIGNFRSNVGNYKSAFASIGDIVSGGLVTGGVGAVVMGLTALGQKAISVNAEISDAIADVAKAADASQTEITALADSLKLRDTRTSLVDQLGIAEIGGKLGVAKDELGSFVGVVDTINVALGDQFGGNVETTTDVLGKLRNVLTDIKSEDISKDLLGIGNSLNFLEAQGSASAGAIADFAGRIAGAARPLGVTSGQILGISATLDELGVNAERGSTAFLGILKEVAKSPEDFAKAANLNAKEFTDLVNNDLFAAVTKFTEGLGSQNLNNTQLAKTLEGLKLSGAGVSEVIGKLSGNMDLLDKRVVQASASLQNGDSITSEFEKKNATLGAEVEKLANSFTNLFASSGTESFFTSLVGGFAEVFTSLSAVLDKLTDWKGAIEGSTLANEIFEKTLFDTREELAKETIAVEKNFNILRNEKASRDQRNEAIRALIAAYPGLLKQQDLEKASGEQLTILQSQLTTNLREQIVERQRLRAKEAIEVEIIQKRLRQVELEATPDRALFGSLTAGETLRNFDLSLAGGVSYLRTDPKRLREKLTSQFNSDIAQLEAQSKAIDERFRLLRNKQAAEFDQISAADQDFLDRRSQFAFRDSKNQGAADTTTAAATSSGESSILKRVDRDSKAAAGSIAYVQELLDKAKKELENAPQNKFAEALAQVTKYEKELNGLNEQLEQIKLRLRAVDAAPFRPNDLVMPNLEGLTDFQAEADALRQEEERKAKEAREKQLKEEQEYLDERYQQQIEQGRRNAAERQRQQEHELKEEKEKRKALRLLAIEGFGSIADSALEIQKNKLSKETENEMEELQRQEAAKLEAVKGNTVAEEAIRADFEKKRIALEKAAAQERKAIALKEAAIQGALAIIKALVIGSYGKAIEAAVIMGLQLAVIQSTSFAKGGMVPADEAKGKNLYSYPAAILNSLPDLVSGGHTGPGLPYEDNTGQRVAARIGTRGVLHAGEYVIKASQVRRFPNLVQALESDRLRIPYATGGFTGGSVPQLITTQTLRDSGVGGVAPVSIAVFTDEQLNMLAQRFAVENAQTAASILRPAIADGLNDTNRRIERESALSRTRTIS